MLAEHDVHTDERPPTTSWLFAAQCYFARLCILEVCGNGFQYSQSLPFPHGHSHSHSRNLCIVNPIPIPILFPKARSHSLPFPFPPKRPNHESKHFKHFKRDNVCKTVMSFAFTDYESQKQDELNTSIRIISD